jgi:hypothetical protein
MINDPQAHSTIDLIIKGSIQPLKLKNKQMKNSKTLVALALAGMFFVACSGNNKEASASDSSSTTTMSDGTATDTAVLADTSVKPADSTRSFRNDRGTDSVSAGKSIPAKP